MKEMSPKLYEQYVNHSKLSCPCYGVGERSNKAGQRETVRDPDSEVSIFDDQCFTFYLIKYCEILGEAALLAVLDHNQISYQQKIKMIDFILKMETEL
tara:strand:+ start:145 stop:438 length:294 start_codon:yes stop_codon:yes gene_type:complete